MASINEVSDTNVWTSQTQNRATAPEPVRPFVLSGSDIHNLPIENFTGDKSHATGGWKQIFNAPDTPTNEFNIGIAHFPPRSADQESFVTLHRHQQAEWYYMLKGQGVVKIEGVEYRCEPGHAFFIPGDAEHGSWNTSETEELVFLWGFAVDGFHQIVFRFSEGAKLIST